MASINVRVLIPPTGLPESARDLLKGKEFTCPRRLVACPGALFHGAREQVYGSPKFGVVIMLLDAMRACGAEFEEFTAFLDDLGIKSVEGWKICIPWDGIRLMK